VLSCARWCTVLCGTVVCCRVLGRAAGLQCVGVCISVHTARWWLGVWQQVTAGWCTCWLHRAASSLHQLCTNPAGQRTRRGAGCRQVCQAQRWLCIRSSEQALHTCTAHQHPHPSVPHTHTHTAPTARHEHVLTIKQGSKRMLVVGSAQNSTGAAAAVGPLPCCMPPCLAQ
jgi:hypothetical protein